MSLCLNPDCSHRNALTDQFCQKCRSKLLLRERYRAINGIGQGGFGKTFQAVDEDKPSKPYCVIKQFFPSAQGTATLEKAAELFKEEATRLDSLGKHPQIPELYAYFTGPDNRQYLVQEYVEGQNLEKELKEQGIFNEEKIRHLLEELLPVLEFIHGKQVIHRDIKPENIIRRKSDNKLVLVDFGAAKLVTPLNRSVTGTIIGSAEYVAPEQSNGKAVNGSDLYSLGVTCLYLLTGVSPFDLFDVGEHEWIWRQFLVNNPVSDDLGNVLDKLVEFGTKKRYQSAEEVLLSLNLRSLCVPTASQVVGNIIQTSLQSFDFETVTVDSRGREIRREKRRADYFTENLGKAITLEMVAIPAGTFMMGSPAGEGHYNEKPQHSVTVSAFFMGKYPITQAQWRVVASLPKIEWDLNLSPSGFSGDNRPVERVSWEEAVEFCKRLSKETGKEYRLPSEAQWEYACRAGTTTPFHFGETITPDLANYNGNRSTYANGPKGIYRVTTTPVGQFLPNAFGLYDMHGNVWEWCEDDWHRNYRDNPPSDGSAWKGSNGSSKVLRGGSWSTYPEYCPSPSRDDNNRALRYFNNGFRVIWVARRTL